MALITYKQKFVNSLNSIADKIKKDGDWKYAQTTSGYTYLSARSGKRTGNCAHYVCWCLRDAGMFPAKGWFYLNNGKIYYNGNADEIKKYIAKYFTVIYTDKPLLKAGLKKGDIIGFKGLSHTCVFEKYVTDEKGNKHAYVWDGGSAANVKGIKKNIHRQKDSYGHNVKIILRPKTFYYKKPSIKTESIIKALENIGVTSTKEYRAEIAKINNIANYTGTAAQNLKMIDLLYSGKLIRA